VAQVRTATARLTAIWYRGGRCSRAWAEAISRRLIRTQHDNAKSDRSHRKATLRRLHEIGLHLKDLHTCQWKPL
jgi:hypothetical protein